MNDEYFRLQEYAANKLISITNYATAKN